MVMAIIIVRNGDGTHHLHRLALTGCLSSRRQLWTELCLEQEMAMVMEMAEMVVMEKVMVMIVAVGGDGRDGDGDGGWNSVYYWFNS